MRVTQSRIDRGRHHHGIHLGAARHSSHIRGYINHHGRRHAIDRVRRSAGERYRDPLREQQDDGEQCRQGANCFAIASHGLDGIEQSGMGILSCVNVTPTVQRLSCF